VTDIHTIDTLDALTQHYSAPRESSTSKIQYGLNSAMQQWLQHSPFFILASTTATGLDCSPRGDAPGKAFCVLDKKTIAIPDRRGNNRIDTLRNIIDDPRVGLVFLIPGIAEALRIKGRASISIKPELLDLFVLDGEQPATVILISITAAYVQNARAVRCANLWRDDHPVAPGLIPDAAQLSTGG